MMGWVVEEWKSYNRQLHTVYLSNKEEFLSNSFLSAELGLGFLHNNKQSAVVSSSTASVTSMTWFVLLLSFHPGFPPRSRERGNLERKRELSTF